MPRRQRGFTLVEVGIAAGIAALLAGIAVPSYQKQIQQARRGDGVAALTALHVAQERYRNTSGLYASTLVALRAAPHSEYGFYAVALRLDGADGYTLVAQPQDSQAQDRACSPLTLTVRQGFESVGPTARCWGR